MSAFAMSTARAFVKPTASSVGMHAAKCSAVRSGAAAVSMPAFRSSGVAAFRGFVGISAAPVVSGFAASQRAAFHVSAVDEDEASVEVSDEAPAAGPVKLYVGNLSWGVDDVTLEEVFGDFQASDMTVVSDMNTGRSRGFGFVTVPSQEEAEKCIAALDGSDVDGRPIRVNISVARGTDRTFGDRPPRAPSERNYDFDARKIYFGNLSW